MGFTRRARRLILLLPQIALAATAGTAAALLARGLSARGKQRRAASIDSGSSACDVECTVLDVDPGACKAPAAACDLGGSSSTLIGWALQQVGLTPSALSTRQIIGRLKSIWITLVGDLAVCRLLTWVAVLHSCVDSGTWYLLLQPVVNNGVTITAAAAPVSAAAAAAAGAVPTSSCNVANSSKVER